MPLSLAGRRSARLSVPGGGSKAVLLDQPLLVLPLGEASHDLPDLLYIAEYPSIDHLKCLDEDDTVEGIGWNMVWAG